MSNTTTLSKSSLNTLTAGGALIALGIVFGDIGTSPLYVMQAILKGAKVVDKELVYGALSCIIWTLTLQTTLKYVIITLRADNNGEGGVFALYTLIRKQHKKAYLFAILGSCALLADGIITPSITVTSAVEGLSMLSPHIRILPIVVMILSGIFLAQRFGTVAIGKFFGPVMLLWFALLGVLGMSALVQDLSVLRAFNPYYAIKLLYNYPGGFILLGAVFLATTGAEALYSDLGHCGRKNIRVAWIYVKVMLIINYLGQGSWILSHTREISTATNPFFGIMPSWFLLPGIIIATAAAIIASQALITGSFTLISEAIHLKLWPRVRMRYPTEVMGQVYIPFVNNFLWIACLWVVFHFQSSANMQAAYGLSITVAMLMTTTLLLYYFRMKQVPTPWIILFGMLFFTIEGSFLAANLNKFFEGAWITLTLMIILGVIMYSHINGLKIKRSFVTSVKLSDTLPLFNDLQQDPTVAMFASNLVYITSNNDPQMIEGKTLFSIFRKQPKKAEHYWFLRVNTLDDPYTFTYNVEELAPKFIYRVTINLGFKEGEHVYDYFRQITRTMEATGRLDLTSPHPSLAKHQIPGAFIFVLVERSVHNFDRFTLPQQSILKLYQLVKKIGSNDRAAYEIDQSVVLQESVPMQNNPPADYPNLKEV